VAALPPGELAAWGVMAVLLRAGHAVGALLAARGAELQPVAEALVGVAVPQQAGRDAAEEPRQAAEAWGAAAVLLGEARAVAVLLRAVPDAQAALPSAVPWAFRRDQVPPWPAPSPAVRFARATERLRIASP
jgi:hypothetical protein